MWRSCGVISSSNVRLSSRDCLMLAAATRSHHRSTFSFTRSVDFFFAASWTGWGREEAEQQWLFVLVSVLCSSVGKIAYCPPIEVKNSLHYKCYYYILLFYNYNWPIFQRRMSHVTGVIRLYYVAAVQENKKQKSKPNVSNINLI